MSDDLSPDDARRTWQQLLQQMLGEEGAREAMEALEAGGFDPAQMAQAAGLPSDAAGMQAMMAQMQSMLASTGTEGVNWSLAHDIARQTAHQGGDPSVTAAESARTVSALSVADLWLDAATDLPPAGGTRSAWSRAQWVEATLETWKRLTGPVGSSVSDALATVLAQSEGLTGGMPELGGLGGPGGLGGLGGAGLDPAAMLRGLGGSVFGLQVGQAAGTLAREVFGSSDTGLPLLERPGTALVPRNVADFAEGLDAPTEEVLAFLAVRESAHARLYAHVPWLRAHILGLVEEYARGIRIDLERLEESVRTIDPSDPEALRSAISGGVFAPEVSPEQAGALERLETALALVEGWVEDVTARTVAPHLPHGVPLREMMRRRRAAGGPSEHVFSTLVGLQLRPRRLREAATLFATLVAEGGPEARDAVWAHPDLLPDAADLDAPTTFTARREEQGREDADFDAALADLLDGGTGAPPSAADDAGSGQNKDDEGDGGPAAP
ncbi:zinc-dependent metalloprotease [Serinibacter arcticus]|uniref:Zinc-dependent metalloprotease n=1 Tax=Serinibacter arcticus TaxID=1655435 RepID=A0A2U1ZTR0_9MICO|nr:zinc-dependent metalloprotease [Serinibacter arcticus]PWD50312.1 zinc-dependent metalloprotease [Serinibacter arcticus]